MIMPKTTDRGEKYWQYKQLINFGWSRSPCGAKGKIESTQVFKLFAGPPSCRGAFCDPNEMIGYSFDDPVTGELRHDYRPFFRTITEGQRIDEISPVAEGWPIRGGHPIARLTVRLVHAWNCECQVTESRFDYANDVVDPKKSIAVPD
jgi:hypothetical protein